jgi:segregation and condensation protein A
VVALGSARLARVPRVGFEVRTPVFEGPFDLLFHLITQEQVDIYEVSLAAIVDAFLAEMEQLEHLALEPATEFLVLAATLVELKTRKLLPGAEVLDDDEPMWLDSRDVLLARMLEYKTFKDAAAMLRRLLDAGSLVVARTAGPEEPFASLAPDPLAAVSPVQLRDAACRALAPKVVEVIDLDQIAPLRISVRDAAEELLAALPRHGSITFRQLTRGLTDRIEIIVRFLAVLELFKQGAVELDQVESFGEISVRLIGGAAQEIDLVALERDWEPVEVEP